MTYSKRCKSTDRNAGENLEEYNAFILQYQEEAFNLALLILDDEAQAMKAVDAVFLSGYGQFTGHEQDFRFTVINRILKYCLDQFKKVRGPEPIHAFLVDLSEEQKIVLILVDCLKMSYQDVASLMRLPVRSIRKILANARYTAQISMSNHDDQV